MRSIDLYEIGYNIENFEEAKNEICDYLLVKDDIKNDNTLFIKWLSISDTIYVHNDDIIPFRLVRTKADNYLFYVKPENNPGLLQSLQMKLETLEYDLSTLRKRTTGEIVNGCLANAPYFVINNDYYN